MIAKQWGMSFPSFLKSPLSRLLTLPANPVYFGVLLAVQALCCSGGDLSPWRCQRTGAGPQEGWCLFSEHPHPPQLSSAHPTWQLSPQQIPAFPWSRHGLWSTRRQVGSRDKLPARKARNVTEGPLTPSGLGAAEMRCDSRLLQSGPAWEGGMFAAPHHAGTKGGPRKVGSRFKSC